MKASELAYAAAKYISEHGHTKNRLEDPDTGAVCLVGAVLKVERWLAGFEKIDVYDTAADLIDGDPVQWNNAPERSGEDVILLLKQVGSVLEEKGQ